MAEITIERCIEEWCFDDDTDYADPAAKAVNDRLRDELTMLRRKAAALDAMEQTAIEQAEKSKYSSVYFETDYCLSSGIVFTVKRWGDSDLFYTRPTLLEAIEAAMEEK